MPSSLHEPILFASVILDVGGCVNIEGGLGKPSSARRRHLKHCGGMFLLLLGIFSQVTCLGKVKDMGPDNLEKCTKLKPQLFLERKPTKIRYMKKSNLISVWAASQSPGPAIFHVAPSSSGRGRDGSLSADRALGWL